MKTPMQSLIDYMRANFHLTDETEEQFKLHLELEKKYLIDFAEKMRIVLNVTPDGYIQYWFDVDEAADNLYKE